MHHPAGCWSSCRGAESCCRSTLNTVCEERLSAKARGGHVFGWEHAPVSSQGLSFILVETTFASFMQHAQKISKKKKKGIVSVGIKYHSSNDTPSLFWSHVLLVTWSGGDKPTNQWSVWDSSLCKHWERKNYAFMSYGKDWNVWAWSICSVCYSAYLICLSNTSKISYP